MGRRVLESKQGRLTFVISSYMISNKKEMYQWNIVQPAKWSEILWQNRSRDKISGGFGTMLWGSDNQSIGGFYEIFHQRLQRMFEAMWYCMILSYFVEATTGVCWRFDVFKNYESKIIRERYKCDSSNDVDTFQQTRVYMEKQWCSHSFFKTCPNNQVLSLFYLQALNLCY